MENKLTSPAQNSFMVNYEKTDVLLPYEAAVVMA